jgi:hypothetical protein
MMKFMRVPANALAMLAFMSLYIFSGCDNYEVNLSGSWRSVSVRNPSPFFKNVLAGYREGSITLALSPDRKYIWTDTLQNMQLKGKFSLRGKEIYLTPEKKGEAIRAWYHIKEQKLIIETDDYFSFTFVRDDKQEYPVSLQSKRR